MASLEPDAAPRPADGSEDARALAEVADAAEFRMPPPSLPLTC
jgi:hypothetical protein